MHYFSPKNRLQNKLSQSREIKKTQNNRKIFIICHSLFNISNRYIKSAKKHDAFIGILGFLICYFFDNGLEMKRASIWDRLFLDNVLRRNRRSYLDLDLGI